MDEFAVDLDKVLDEFEETEGIVFQISCLLFFCVYIIIKLTFETVSSVNFH